MRINPLGHGKHNNLYASAKRYGVKIKLVMFFDSGYAYIMSVRRSNPDIKVDWDAFYQELSRAVEDMDFELKTPRKRIYEAQYEFRAI